MPSKWRVRRVLCVKNEGRIPSQIQSASLNGNAGLMGVSYRVVGPDGWHEVVERERQGGLTTGCGAGCGRIVSPVGAFPDASWLSFLAPCVSSMRFPSKTLSGDGSSPPPPSDAHRHPPGAQQPASQPVRTSPEPATSAHAYCSAHPSWAVPGFPPSPPPILLLYLHVCLSSRSALDPQRANTFFRASQCVHMLSLVTSQHQLAQEQSNLH